MPVPELRVFNVVFVVNALSGTDVGCAATRDVVSAMEAMGCLCLAEVPATYHTCPMAVLPWRIILCDVLPWRVVLRPVLTWGMLLPHVPSGGTALVYGARTGTELGYAATRGRKRRQRAAASTRCRTCKLYCPMRCAILVQRIVLCDVRYWHRPMRCPVLTAAVVLRCSWY
eukprot:755054-Rhodomonas_salina.7